jgi:hypothetical protein
VAQRGDPVRWLHPDSDIPEELRRVLASARTDGGGQDALASLAAKLPVATGAKVPVSAALGASKKAILSWKLAAWVAGAAALSGAATNLIALAPAARPPAAEVAEARGTGAHTSQPQRPSDAEKPGEPERPSPPAGTSEPERPSHAAKPSEPETSSRADRPEDSAPLAARPAPPAGSDIASPRGEPAASAAAARKAEAPPALAAQGPAPAASAGSLAAEAKMLLQAREAMQRDPAKALRAAEDHGTAFSDGALAEEREVLRVEALVRLGKREEAAAAASSFRARHPQSSHLARIDRLLRSAK